MPGSMKAQSVCPGAGSALMNSFIGQRLANGRPERCSAAQGRFFRPVSMSRYNGHEGHCRAHRGWSAFRAGPLPPVCRPPNCRKAANWPGARRPRYSRTRLSGMCRPSSSSPRARSAKCPWAAPCAVKAGVFGKRVKRAPYKAGVKTIEIGIPGFWQRQYSPEAPDSARGKRKTLLALSPATSSRPLSRSSWPSGEMASELLQGAGHRGG